MAESFPKRQKIEMESGKTSRQLAIGKAIETILKIDNHEFQRYVGNMEFDGYTKLTGCLSKIDQAMKDSRPSFSNIPVSAVVVNMFQYLENRTDWNNFALVNKEINKAVREHKDLTPPWPEGEWIHDSIDGYSRPKFSDDGEFIAYSNYEGYIYIWSRRKGLVASLEGHLNGNSSVSFSPCSNFLVWIGRERIKVWDLADNNLCLWEATTRHDNVVFSPTNDEFATFGHIHEPLVILWNTSDGSISQDLISGIKVKLCAAFSPHGRTLAICGRQNAIELWNLDDSESTATLLDGDDGDVLAIAYSPNGNFLASASFDMTINIWDVAKEQCVQSLAGHTMPRCNNVCITNVVASLSFSPDGKFLASGSEDDDIRVWCMASGNCVETVNVGSVLRSVEFSKDGKMLLAAKEYEDVIMLRYVNLP
jgi:WD40 repeat protein